MGNYNLEIDDLLDNINVEEVANKRDNPPDKDKKTKKKADRSNAKFTGPLTLSLDTAYSFPGGYSPEVLQLKEFMDSLGDQGFTFEKFFENVEKDGAKTDISKMKNALYRINSHNQISMKIIHKICKATGYGVTLSFLKEDNPEELFSDTVTFD